MTFKIATAEEPQATPREYDGVVTFRGFADRADRKMRQIVAQIEACENAADVDATIIEHDFVIDAMMLDYPYMAETVQTAATDHKAILGSVTVTPDAAAPATTVQSNVLNKTF